MTIETPQPDPAAADKLLAGGGEMGALIAPSIGLELRSGRYLTGRKV